MMNSFNKTEAAVFSCRLCFRGAFPFISLLCLEPSALHEMCLDDARETVVNVDQKLFVLTKLDLDQNVLKA